MNRMIVAALFAAVAVCANAETTDETLLVPPYPAATPWKNITDKSNALMLMREWIPADQTEDDIKDILTEQHFFKGQMTPADFVKGMFQRVRGQCESLRANGPVERIDNGFAVAYAQLYCSHQKGTDKDIDIFLKAIAGTKAFYVVQYEIRRPADKNRVGGVIEFSGDQLEAVKAMMARQGNANKYLSEQVKLCAAIDAKGVCLPGTVTEPPKPVAAPGGMRRLADDASADYGFTAGKSTADEVRKKFGKPITENHNPDGRFVLMFDAPEGKGRMLGCLFDSAGVLTAIRRYGTE
ncbi:hypothetical protein [Rhizomicrobium electricum]|uniref:Uncharacterized protein n=1 Tax=Rhizomicrobium electricum TaxID=480070 RepID=A0ABP3QBF6_9PROT|nr:hypothetical protein [Rhizomicrobium electricum]NIJ50579.1 hypothetical protein [Rhizomicrobium electricum]